MEAKIAVRTLKEQEEQTRTTQEQTKTQEQKRTKKRGVSHKQRQEEGTPNGVSPNTPAFLQPEYAEALLLCEQRFA